MPRIVTMVPVDLRRWAKAHVTPGTWEFARRLATGHTLPQRVARTARSRAVTVRFGASTAPTAVVSAAGQPLLGLVVSAFRSGDTLADHLSLVADALERHDVPYFVLDAQAERRRIVVVDRAHRRRAWDALLAEHHDSTVYVAKVRDSRPVSPRLLGRQSIPRRAAVVRVFKVLASPTGGFLSGPELGCDIEFWQVAPHDRPAYHNGEPVPAGTLIAPRTNRWADTIVPSEQQTELRPVDGTLRPRLATIDRAHVFSVREPVDVVYTWVDGSDPEWLMRKAAIQDDPVTRSEILHALATNESRFASRDELRYSLRSLDMYADWVRHVYLVTDDQVPSWLDTTNPRITVVSHRELFGERGRLPTFNSHAIESQLHRIPGLSEQYLYLNDDVFFGRPLSPSLFFHGNGTAIFFLSGSKIGLGDPSPEDAPVMSAAKRNRDLFLERYGLTISQKFQHTPHALRRSVMQDLEREFEKDFIRTSETPFRSHEDISVSSSLGHYYGYVTGRAIPGAIRYFYADIARVDTPARLASLLRDRDYDVFCLNDHDSRRLDPEVQARIIGEFLEAYYPMPSSFEKADEAPSA